MIFVSSSDSFGSDGVASTSDTFSRFSCRRWSAGTSTLVELRRLLRELRAGLDVAAWFARAAIASVSSVMKVCWTQPAWPAWMPSFNVVALAPSRNFRASAAVGAGEDVVAVRRLYRIASAAAHMPASGQSAD